MTKYLSKFISTQLTHSFTPSPSGGRLGWGWVIAALLLTTPVHATTTTLIPTADAYVQAGANANKNYGSATTLRVQTNATAAKNYDSYLKFDANSATGTISSAKLRVYAKLSASGTVSTSAYAIATTTWGETTLTWNNKPATGAALGNISVTSTGYAWKEIDVTAYVQGEFNANRKLLSFAYNSGTASSLLTTLQSREGTNKPQLVIITSNAAPTVSLTAPANSSSYVAPASITISANAADTDGTISSVAFYNGATLINTDTSAPYSYTWIGVASGNYILTAKATDNAGAVATSSPVNISVTANQAPTVSLQAPTSSDSFTAPATFSIIASAADSDGSIQKVEFYNGNTLLGSATQSPYLYDWLNVAAGSYTLTAKAFDNANASTTSAPVNITVNAPQVAAGIYYIFADHLNTPRVITDATNKTVWRWESDPFGTDMAYEDPDGDGIKFGYNLRFPGQYFDKETGLHYNYFRDYDPGTGRYVQSDPIGLDGGSFSTYAYVGNPISDTDPLGLMGSGGGGSAGSGRQQSETCPSDCPDPITFSTRGVCRDGDALCAQAMKAAGIQEPYFSTTRTYSLVCILKLGIGVAGGKAAVGTVVVSKAPNIATKMGAGAAAVANVSKVAATLNSPPAMIAGATLAVASVRNACECPLK